MLGIFDSGLGGLTVVRRVRALLPRHDLLFLADQAHVPYGDRTAGELALLLAQNLAYLERRGVDAIVMGCNTTCAVADERGWPPTRVPVLDLIESAAEAVAAIGAERVGVVATAATVRSGAYGRRIRARAPHVEAVQEIAAPALVPLVESGASPRSAVARAAVGEVCRRFAGPLDALVLACTHYPVLDETFAAALPGTRRIDPAHVQAERAVELVQELGIRPGAGRTHYVTSGDPAAFRASIERVLGGALDDAEQVEKQQNGEAA